MATTPKLLMVFLIFHDRLRGIVGADPNKNQFIHADTGRLGLI